MTNVLVVNCGSTSLKIALVLAWQEEEQYRTEIVWKNQSVNLASHQARDEAIEILFAEMERKTSVKVKEVSAIGHRVVHGGTQFIESTILDRNSLECLSQLTELAPLHNQVALEGVKYCFDLYQDIPQIAVFDTGFHHSMPVAKRLYAVPYNWYKNFALRKFGFHGINVEYCSSRFIELFDRTGKTSKMIVCHLGGGCSITALVNGKSVDTSMGFTPLDGVMMATRSGSIDPGVLPYMLKKLDCDIFQIEKILNRQSGIKGVSGLTGDMQELLEASQAGLDRARLALDMFIDSVVKHIGMMTASIDGIDSLVFTGGIGEGSCVIREEICKRLQYLGIGLDSDLNLTTRSDCLISSGQSRVSVAVIKADEYSQIAKHCHRLLSSN